LQSSSKKRERVVFQVRFCLPGTSHMHHNPRRRWSLLIAHPRPLIDVCAAIPDLRKPRGKHHPLSAICALAWCARHVITPKTTEEQVEVVYGVTSLRPERGTPERLREFVRGPWRIENKSHWVRDVTFDADRSQVRCGNIPLLTAGSRISAWLLRRVVPSAGRSLPGLSRCWALVRQRPLHASLRGRR
jgi:predicted transposase YbfD/YdcC